MEQAKRSISELIKAVTDELYRMGYSPATVPRFNLVWKKFQLYAESKGSDHFSEELGEKFLKELINYPCQYEKKFPYQARIAV